MSELKSGDGLRPVPVSVSGIPPANATYSQATVLGNLVFVSGQLGIDPATGQLAGEDIESQTRQALENVKAVLEAAGSSLEKVARCNVFYADFALLARANAVYSQYFSAHKPAKTGVQVARLDKGGLIEIEVTAAL